MLLQLETQALQSINQIGGNLTVIGVLLVVSYFLYSALIKSSEKRDTKEKELRVEYRESIKEISDAYRSEASENRQVFKETIDEVLASHEKHYSHFAEKEKFLLDKILNEK